jgi:signal transduction histidine kinase
VRLAWLYPLAWLPYLAAYGLALGNAIDLPVRTAAFAAAANVLPPALLGPAVLGLARRLAWPSRRRARFFALHAAAMLAYAVLSVAGTWGLFILLDLVRDRAWPSLAGWDWRPLPWQLFVAVLLYAVLASLAYAALLLVRLRDEEARLARARELAAEAELKALRARLNPHFLFNALHSLLSLVRHDPAAAETGIERLGDLLHYVLGTQEGDGEEVSLAADWRFVGDYLEIEALRLGDRLSLTTDLDPAAAPCRVPAFCLQPLVENAVRHAIAPRATGGRLTVRARREDGWLKLEVEDDGPGADAETLEAEEGRGLRLVRRRLEALYGERAALAVRTRPGEGFLAAVRLPAIPAAGEGGG